jgi:hypothetical protein
MSTCRSERARTARPRSIKAKTEGREASDRPEDATYTLHHCHCLLDIPGLEHRDDEGEPTGLPLPYIVTVEPRRRPCCASLATGRRTTTSSARASTTSTTNTCPALGFYGWGLIHLLGATPTR